MDVNEESVAPWNLDGRVDDDAESGDGISEVTTATGCAVSRRRARIFWDKLCTCLLLLAVDEAEDQRVRETVVAKIVGGRNMDTKKGKSLDSYPVRETNGVDRFAVTSMHSLQLGLNWSADCDYRQLWICYALMGHAPLFASPFITPSWRSFCCHLSQLARLGPTEFRP